MFYKLAQKALFAADPEQAHDLALNSLRMGHALGATRWLCQPQGQPFSCMGLEFPNRVGLAAGLDKNADYFEALGDLGFGFIEVGTVTPRPQAGNPRPRVFRIPQAQALINRLGFNNLGIDHLLERIKGHRFKGILGINIGKNADTPVTQAVGDYIHCLEKVYPHAGYVTVNISSPNTPGLRDLQSESALGPLLNSLAEQRERLADRHGRRVPMALKVAPDLEPESMDSIARLVSRHGMDALIATNTTIRRSGVAGLAHAEESGGLSGPPLKHLADEVLRAFQQRLQGEVVLIGVGGINSGPDAADKLNLGASLVQMYTGLVYQGPKLVRDCIIATERLAQA